MSRCFAEARSKPDVEAALSACPAATLGPNWRREASAGARLAPAVIQGTQHNVLARGFDARAHELLVVTNWLRTAIWTTRGAALLWVLAVTMRRGPEGPPHLASF
jgi:hypothetical protein